MHAAQIPKLGHTKKKTLKATPTEVLKRQAKRILHQRVYTTNQTTNTHPAGYRALDYAPPTWAGV